MADRPLHILHVTTNAELGGGELCLVSLVAKLDRAKFASHVICPPGPLAQRLRASGVSVRAMPVGRLGSYQRIVPRIPWRTLWALFRDGLEQQVDVVHAHHYEAAKTAAVIARLLGAPCLWTSHGFWFKVSGLEGRYVAAAVDHTVAVSEFVKEKLMEGGALRKGTISVIYNAVDDRLLTTPVTDGSRMRERLGLPPSAFVIGIIGRLDPVKNHEDFLQAFKLVAERMPDVRAVVVGSEILVNQSLNYGTSIRRLARELGVGDSVIFAGFQDDMPAVYDVCDLIVLTSHGEAFALVLVEAMARRRAVIATRCGGPAEIIGEDGCGVLVPVGNVDRLAQAMLQVASDRELRLQTAERGYRRVMERFTLDRQANQYEELYLRLWEARRT